MTQMIYISYDPQDATIVQQLKADLSAAGATVLPDGHDLLPGIGWQDAVRQEIQRATHFLACFSSSGAINPDLALAIERARVTSPARFALVPVRLESCEIPQLQVTETATLRDCGAIDWFSNRANAVARIVGVKPRPSVSQAGSTIQAGKLRIGTAITETRASGQGLADSTITGTEVTINKLQQKVESE